MQFKTLAFIVNLLENEEHKTSLTAKWLRETFLEKESDYDQGLISKSEYKSVKEQYDTARDKHNAAAAALEEFLSKNWQ